MTTLAHPAPRVRLLRAALQPSQRDVHVVHVDGPAHAARAALARLDVAAMLDGGLAALGADARTQIAVRERDRLVVAAEWRIAPPLGLARGGTVGARLDLRVCELAGSVSASAAVTVSAGDAAADAILARGMAPLAAALDAVAAGALRTLARSADAAEEAA